MIKRLLAPFKVLPTGYYRLFLLFWVVAILFFAIYMVEIADNHQEEESLIGGFAIGLIGYYLAMRIVLWVYNGFKQDKNK
ncbi:MAG TPA: hypothetical protein PLU02_10765 [Chitinophagales bacterium]|nr:hypothetical protein [Chitinophagales bacterium]